MILIQPDKINRMTELFKCSLPKVKLRVRTTSAETVEEEPEAHFYKQFAVAPPVYQDRLKMGKQIQETFIRFRRRKKNNYIKRFNSLKKNSPNPEEKRISTLEMKKNLDQKHSQINFTLDVDSKSQQRISSVDRPLRRENPTLFVRRVNEQTKNRQILTSSYKPCSQIKQPTFLDDSLYNTEIRCGQNPVMQLHGKKINYLKFADNKRVLNLIVPNIKHRERQIKRQDKSAEFKIEAWRPDQVCKFRPYYGNQAVQLDD